MKLTVTLTDLEAGDIAGWVNYYRAHPEYVGVPKPAHPASPPNYQTRIVLDSQSSMRYAEIAAQFPVAPPVPPVGPFEIIIYTHADGINQEWTFAPGTVYAIEMLMPPGPYPSQPYVYGGIAQVPSGAVAMLGKLSATAGDIAGAPQNPNPSFNQDAQPGQRWYFNVSLLPGWAMNERVRFSAFFPR